MDKSTNFIGIDISKDAFDLWNPAKGKSKKLALVAVGNKLLKQVFVVAKSNITHDPDFKFNFSAQ